MLSEKVLFALNTVNDAYLEETRELLDRSAVSQKPAKSRIVRTILIAAVLAALMAATAYAIVSIHQKRQQELRASLKIEENQVAGYVEFEEASTPEETASEPKEKETSVQLISTFRNGEFVNVYFSISPISREEAWDAINHDTVAICTYASNSSHLEDAHLKKNDRDNKDVYGKVITRPPIQEDKYLRAVNSSPEELMEKYYDQESQSLMLRERFVLSYDAVDWSKPVYINVKMIDFKSLQTPVDMSLSVEENLKDYHPICLKDYGTVSFVLSDTEYINADLRNKEILVSLPSSDKVLQVLGVKIYASEVEWQVTHEDVDLIFNLPRDDDETFRKGYELMLDWLTVYDQVLDGSALIMEDGTQVKLNPSESTPYENGVVTLYSRLPSTIDLRKVDAISIMGQEVSISNPFQSTEEPSS